MKCSICFQEKFRVRGSRRPGTGYYYIDDVGSLWNGHKCPSCFRGDNIKKQPSIKAETTRRCRKCKGKLPESRYFRHASCDVYINDGEGTGFYGQDDWGYASHSEALNSGR